MDYILRKFKYKDKPQTTPKMVITSPKSLEDDSTPDSDEMKLLEEHIPLNHYDDRSNRSEQASNYSSGHIHKRIVNSNDIRHPSHHSSHYSLNSSPSHSFNSSDGLEHKQLDRSAIAQMLLSRPVIVKRNCFDEQLTHLNDNSFAVDCLYWHNVFREKHGSPPLTLSHSLIAMAQELFSTYRLIQVSKYGWTGRKLAVKMDVSSRF